MYKSELDILTYNTLLLELKLNVNVLENIHSAVVDFKKIVFLCFTFVHCETTSSVIGW